MTKTAIIQMAADELIGIGTLSSTIVGNLNMASELAGQGDIDTSLSMIAWCVSSILGSGTADNSVLRGKCG